MGEFLSFATGRLVPDQARANRDNSSSSNDDNSNEVGGNNRDGHIFGELREPEPWVLW